MLPLKLSHIEQCAVIVLFVGKKFNANQFHSDASRIWQQVFSKPAVHV